MEPFGILQFLQSLLPQAQPQNKPEGVEPPQPTDDTKPQTEENGAQNTGAQEAFMSFLQAHENRAKRTKRN